MAKFGTQEEVTCIQDVSLKGPNDESLCLGYKVSTKFFIAGVYVKDDEYVLGIKGESSYLPIPEGADLADFRAEGLLPAVFPAYRIPTLDYVVGYSLWIILGGYSAFMGLRYWWRRRRGSPSPDHEGTPGSGSSVSPLAARTE